jgi:5-formyltetrahydrofolate cyclo-ligase
LTGWGRAAITDHLNFFGDFWSGALSETSPDKLDAKGQMRRAAYDARNAQADKDRVSDIAVAALVQLPEYQAAKTVMWYLDCRSELRTRQALPAALASGKAIVVPYCTLDDAGANKLGLWWLQSLDELVIGKWKILEPPRERWGEAGKDRKSVVVGKGGVISVDLGGGRVELKK